MGSRVPTGTGEGQFPSNLSSPSMDIQPIAPFDFNELPSSPRRGQIGTESVTPSSSTDNMGPPQNPPTMKKKNKKKRNQCKESHARRTLVESGTTSAIHRNPSQTLTVTEEPRTENVLRLRSPRHHIYSLVSSPVYQTPFSQTNQSPSSWQESWQYGSPSNQGFHLISSPNQQSSPFPYASPIHQPRFLQITTPPSSPFHVPASSPIYEGQQNTSSHFQSNLSPYPNQTHQEFPYHPIYPMMASPNQQAAHLPYASPIHQPRFLQITTPSASPFHASASSPNYEGQHNTSGHFQPNLLAYQNPNEPQSSSSQLQPLESEVKNALGHPALQNAMAEIGNPAPLHQFTPRSLGKKMYVLYK